MTDHLYASDEIVVPWLDRLSDLWPDRIALTQPEDDRHYSFTDLQRRAYAAAAALSARGVRQGDRVATLLPNDVTTLDLLFACQYLGAILVPLNWRLTVRELTVLLADTEPRLLVCAPEHAALADACASQASILTLQEEWPGGQFPAPATVRGTDPWLLLYTGGTTGTPKGAVLTHSSVTWNAINTAVSWGLSPNDIGPSFTPMFHTGGLNVFTLPLLLLGGRVLLPRRFNPADALAMIETQRPTVLFMVPTMFQLLADEPAFDGADLSSVRWAISGGAPLPEALAQRWRRKVPVFKQGYGLTEVGPNNFATPDSEAGRRAGTVGRLTVFARARIVDGNGDDMPDGHPGELLLAGPHMCAGYWRRPKETAEAIRDGWFHTGDIARRDPEGYYYIVDRCKDMIISGGENIYPSEIEAVLYGHPAVREVAVVGLPDRLWGEAVCAVFSLRNGMTTDTTAIQQHAQANLARHKVPKTFLLVDDLPKSAAGKILRAAARTLAIEQTAENSAAASREEQHA